MNTIHRPAAFALDDRPLLLDFVAAHDFVMLVTCVDGAPLITHLPVLVDVDRGVLTGHLARANPQAALLDGSRATVIARGPHGYVSPRWYRSAGQVPTWNYAVVHVTGTVRLLPRGARRGVIDALTSKYEQGAWDSGRLADRAREAMIDAIEAFEIDAEILEGKFKLGQNRQDEDRFGAAAALDALGEGGRALAAMMRMPPRRG